MSAIKQSLLKGCATLNMLAVYSTPCLGLSEHRIYISSAPQTHKVAIDSFKPAPPPPVAIQVKRMALTHQSKGMLAKAILEYRKAIELNPDDAGSHNNLAMAYKDMGLTEDAEKEERIALRLKPQSANYHYNLGVILQNKTKLKQAISELRKAAKIKDDSDIHFRMARVYLERQKPADAERELRHALGLKPHEPTYLILLGDSLMLQERDSDALAAYSQAVRSLKKPDLDLRNKIEFLTEKDQNAVK